MSRFGRVLVLGLIGGGLAGFACGKGPEQKQGNEEEEVTTPPEVFGKTTFNPQLVVIDPAGEPIANATVTFGTMFVKSNEDGVATLPEQAADKTTVVTVAAAGYAPVTRTLSLTNASAGLPVELPVARDFSLDSETGGGADVGAAQIRFPGGAFLRPDGTSYEGAVRVLAATVFDSKTGNTHISAEDRMAPGAGEQQPVEIRSAIHVQLKTAEGGALQFAAGEKAVLSFDLSGEQGREVGETLPLFHLDETTGLWTESSSCTVQDVAEPGQERKLACVGAVEHFSCWGWGWYRPPQNFCRKVVFKAVKPFAAGTFWSWSPVLMDFAASCSWTNPSKDAPQGACTLRAYMPARPDTVRLETMLTIRRSGFLRDRQFVRIGLAGSYDGACPETVLYYNPTTRTMTLDAPPPTKPGPVDKDGDGYFAKSADTLVPGEDCDDGNKAINPGAKPVPCTGKDHDCDGKPDISLLAQSQAALPDQTWNATCYQTKLTCAAALGPEMPGNSRDEDCNDFVSDADGDGFFRRTDPLFAASGKAADCNDYSPLARPGGTEMPGNLHDENCDGVAADQDGDGYPSAKQLALEGESQTTTGVDCNDLDKNAYPGSAVRDLPVLGQFYEGGRRKADFCSLFDGQGKPTARLRNLFYVADRNCNGVLEDLDGDGKLVPAAGMFANVPPYDGNDLDPRVQTKGQVGSPNEKECSPDLNNFGAGSREVCPRLFNREQQCVDTYDQSGQPTGEFACGSPEWTAFSIPPTPYGFREQYGPCSTMVLPDCGAQLLCGGPIKFASWYQEALKRYTPAYDVTTESFTGFCMPGCDEVP
jgi:hypothetical protein